MLCWSSFCVCGFVSWLHNKLFHGWYLSAIQLICFIEENSSWNLLGICFEWCHTERLLPASIWSSMVPANLASCISSINIIADIVVDIVISFTIELIVAHCNLYNAVLFTECFQNLNAISIDKELYSCKIVTRPF